MSRPRIIHERDAYPTRERRNGTALAYSVEADMFHDFYPDYIGPGGKGIIDRDTAEQLIEKVYARYAPTRKRPRLNMPQYRRKSFGASASYTVSTHTIWAPKGWLDPGILLHELAHSLTWRQDWRGHGPEFFRMLIELNCWYLRMSVDETIEDAEDAGMDVADELRLGHDPSKVRWIRSRK